MKHIIGYLHASANGRFTETTDIEQGNELWTSILRTFQNDQSRDFLNTRTEFMRIIGPLANNNVPAIGFLQLLNKNLGEGNTEAHDLLNQSIRGMSRQISNCQANLRPTAKRRGDGIPNAVNIILPLALEQIRGRICAKSDL